MIDREWFSSLRFTSVTGGEVIETKLGTEKAVFIVQNEDGEKNILKMYKNHLGLHINEIPPMVSKNQLYQVDDLNLKLEGLLGNPYFDLMPHDFDRLHSLVAKIVFEHGITGVIASLFTPDSIETVPFILNTPGLKRRVSEMQEMTSPKAEREDMPITINGPNFPINLWPGVTKWTGIDLETIRYPEEYKPETLNNNPLFIWGGAVLDGFFTDEELPIAAQYIETRFGSLPSRPDAMTIIAQMNAIANLLAQYFDNVNVERLVKFCALCGVLFDVYDKDGKNIANGLSYM